MAGKRTREAYLDFAKKGVDPFSQAVITIAKKHKQHQPQEVQQSCPPIRRISRLTHRRHTNSSTNRCKL